MGKSLGQDRRVNRRERGFSGVLVCPHFDQETRTESVAGFLVKSIRQRQACFHIIDLRKSLVTAMVLSPKHFMKSV